MSKLKKIGRLLLVMAPVVFSLSLAEAHPVVAATDACASCGMVVTKYPGPKGVIEDGSHRAFCSARALACEVLAHGGKENAWVHDAGRTSWSNPDDAAFVRADAAWYVYASQKKAVMGPSLAPFVREADARAFQKENGGTLYRFDELTPGMLGCRAHN